MELLIWKCDRASCRSQVEAEEAIDKGWFLIQSQGQDLHYCDVGCIGLDFFREVGWGLDEDLQIIKGQRPDRDLRSRSPRS